MIEILHLKEMIEIMYVREMIKFEIINKNKLNFIHRQSFQLFYYNPSITPLIHQFLFIQFLL